MDLSRVFADQPHQQSVWGAQYPGDDTQAFSDAARAVGSLGDAVSTLQSQVAALQAAVEATRQAYAAACVERDQLRAQHANATSRLQDVQRVVTRYAVVEEPVVASDGYTYERRIIERYLADCRGTKAEAISQQTKEVLTDVLLPNQSLRKLVDLLKTARPDTAPTPAAGTGGAGAQQNEKSSQQQMADNGQGGGAPSGERLHPCVRVYGFCNYKESCTYANYPYDACLSHLKGKCRFGAQCHEFHVDYKRPAGAPGGGINSATNSNNSTMNSQVRGGPMNRK